MLQIIKEFLPLALACLIGAIAFKNMNAFYRLLFAQLLLTVLIYIGSYGITEYQKSHGQPQNNHWLFNISIFIETTLLMAAAYNYYSEKSMQYLTLGFYTMFVLVFTILMIRDGIMRFSHFGDLTASLIILIAFSFILRDFFHTHKSALFAKPELWACGGLLLYFTCNIPYISLFNYLNENYPKESEFLFHLITDVLAGLRYFFLAISFWLIYRNSTTLKLKTHE